MWLYLVIAHRSTAQIDDVQASTVPTLLLSKAIPSIGRAWLSGASEENSRLNQKICRPQVHSEDG